MGIGARTTGAWAAGTSSVSPAIPGGTTTGDMMLLFCIGKPYNETINTPVNWTLLTAGSGSNGTVGSGLDTGSVVWAVFYREWQTGDSNPNITFGGFPNVNLAVIKSFRKTTATWETPVAAKGSDTSSGTGFSLTMDADPGITVGDMLVHFAGIAGNNATFGTPTITATSATIGTVTEHPTIEGTTTLGDDLEATSSYALCTAGTATAAPVCGWTLSTAQTGGGCIVRLRSSGAETSHNLTTIKAFWPLGDPYTASTLVDISGYNNTLDTQLTIKTCTLPFRMGGNTGISYANPQQVFGALKGWGKWDRLLTATEKTALNNKEYWPFSTTTSLQDAKVYYLLEESGGSTTYIDSTGRGNDLTATGTTVQVTGPTGSDYATRLCTTADLVTFTASITSDVMDVTAVASGTLAVGMAVMDKTTTYFGQYFITSFGTGTGGTGTYNITTGGPNYSSRNMVAIKRINLSKTTPGGDLQSGPSAMTIAGWISLNSKQTSFSTNQQVFWGQLVNGTVDSPVGSGYNVYFDPTADRFVIDIDAGDGMTLASGSFVFDSVTGSPTLNTWYFVMLEFDRINNQAKISVNNGVGNTLNPILQPIPVVGKINNGSQFQLNPTGNFATRTSGWDTPPPVNGNCNGEHAVNAHLAFGNNSKTVWGWFKTTNPSTYQTLAGFFNGAGAGVPDNTDWAVQISGNNLYFTFGMENSYVATTMSDINWHLFVAWYDADTNWLYLDIDNGTYTVNGPGPTTPQTVSHDFRLGSDTSNGGSNHQFLGILEAWGISDGNPSQTDLNNLWNGGAGWIPSVIVAKKFHILQAINRSNYY